MIKLEESGLNFSEQEKFFFVNENNEISTYINSKGITAPIFTTDAKRSMCMEIFLAYHSLEIGQKTNSENLKEGSFLYLLFNGDFELYQASTNPEKYKSAMSWKTKSDFPEDSVTYGLINDLKDIVKPYTGVLLQVNQQDEDSILYICHYKIMAYELFAELRLPWVISHKDKPIVVYLSCFHKNLFFGGGDKSLKVDFYPINDEYEFIITDEGKKNIILSEISEMALQKEKELGTIDEPNKVTVLKFKNGDRDVLSAWTGTIKYRYHETVEIDAFKDEIYYSTLQKTVDPILNLTYIPGSDKVMYFGITKKI